MFLSKIKKNKGFTLIELMLVMVIAAVMASLKMQDDKLDMAQLQSRKLGVNELFVYNVGVQKYISSLAGDVPASGAYPQFYTGVDWLKNQKCLDPALTETPAFVPCSFLSNSGGKTTLGAMSFATTISYDSASGYTARTVLSTMAGTAAGESNSGVLGMAALVASGSLAGIDGGASSGGSITYCPDITPMPAGMVSICGTVRDQIVMIVNANGTTDHWLRVDHGNVMRHVIEFGTTAGATPALNTELDDVHPTMRQIRNVARIYNMGASGNENLYIGNKNGSSATGMATLASNAVIIDADQEVLGDLIIQGNIISEESIQADNDIIAKNNIISTNGNASINGWIRAENGDITSESGDIISSSGDLVASTGSVKGSDFIDSDDSSFYMDFSGDSKINSIDIEGELNANGTAKINIIRTKGSSCSSNGEIARTSSGQLLSCVSGTWSGGGASDIAVSEPFNIAYNGTNNYGTPMIVYGRMNGSPWSPNAEHVNRVNLKVCGKLVGYNSQTSRDGWHSGNSSVSGIVPPGCTWDLGYSSNSYTLNRYASAQLISIE